MASIRLENQTGYAQHIRARTHVLTADEPLSNGGSDTGPAPYELLLASLAACTSLTLRMYAERKAWPLKSIRVDVHFSRDANGVESINRTVEVGGELTEEQRGRLAEICEKTPVTKTIKRGTEIVTALYKERS